MSETVEGMARAYRAMSKTPHYSEEGMKAALLWLAANVSDEMVAAWAASNGSARDDIAAALRAAAGGEK